MDWPLWRALGLLLGMAMVDAAAMAEGVNGLGEEVMDEEVEVGTEDDAEGGVEAAKGCSAKGSNEPSSEELKRDIVEVDEFGGGLG